MTSRRVLSLQEKVTFITERERGLSHRELRDKFHVSLGAVSNILKRKFEYTSNYETNKPRDDLSQKINDNVYEWFIAQRSKNISISGPVLQEYARKIGEELGEYSDKFKASNGWLDRFRNCYNIQFRAFDYMENSEDLPAEEPPQLSEALEMVQRLHLLSTTQQLELHSFIVQLKSQLTDVFLESNISKQRTIHEFFKPASSVSGEDFGK